MTKILSYEQWKITFQMEEKKHVCQTCNGSGGVYCDKCHGDGVVEDKTGEETVCPYCDDGSATCPTCGGDGHTLRALYTTERNRETELARKWGLSL